MHSKRKYIELFNKAIENCIEDSNEVVVFYGQEGIGKSTFKNEIIKKYSEDIDICDFDLMLYVGYSFSSVLDTLYYLCDNLEAKKMTKIFKFDIADTVYCSKVVRVPRMQRKKNNVFSRGSDIEGIISNLVDIPYLGSAIKTVELLNNGYKQLKNNSKLVKNIIHNYNSMELKELEETLPKALADDISQNNKKVNLNKKKVIIIDNFERIWGEENELISRTEKEKWIYEIIKASKNVIWVIFSNERVDWDKRFNFNQNIKQYEIEKLSKDEIKKYINKNESTYIMPDNIKEKLFELSEGIPYKLDLIIKYCNEKYINNVDIKEEELISISSEKIILSLINKMSERGRELLYLVAVAIQFDKELIRKLNPSYPFELHKEKYERSFLKINNRDTQTYYELNSYISTAILNIIGEEQKAYYNKTIFEYYYSCLRQLLNIEFDLGIPYKIDYCFNNFRIHGRNLKNKRIYVMSLLDLNDALINNRSASMLLEEYIHIYKKRTEYNIDNEIIIKIIEQRARLSLIIGNYTETVQAVDDGINIIDKEKDISSYANLLCYKMKVQDMYQTSYSENITQEAINTAEEYLKCLHSSNDIGMNKAIAERNCEIMLFLGKQHVTLGNNSTAEKYYNDVLKTCDDNIKYHMNYFYKYKAIALEKMGEIYAISNNKERSKELYEKALTNYEIAEYYLKNSDYDIILNNGLAWKRMAESYFSLNNIDKAIECIDNAILKYHKVENIEPNIIDIYCKKGFAYLDSAERLLNNKENITDKIDVKINEYINKGVEAGNKGLNKLSNSINKDLIKNRQIFDIISKGKRLLAKYNQDKQSEEIVIEYYKDAINAGEEAIKNTPGHIYAYSGYSEACLMYCEYLKKNDAFHSHINEYCNKGLETIEKALEMSNTIQRFISIKSDLKEIQVKYDDVIEIK